MVIWGDGGALTKKSNSHLMICCGFLLMNNLSWKSIFMLAGCCKDNRTRPGVHGEGNDTWGIIWEYLVHGFNALFDGEHPLLDPYGRGWPVCSRQHELAGNKWRRFLFWCCLGVYVGPRVRIERDIMPTLQLSRSVSVVPVQSKQSQL